MEKTIISKNENQSKNLFKFLIPSLFGLLLFVIPLPYGKLFKLDGLSPINIGIGFLAELIKIIAADFLMLHLLHRLQQRVSQQLTQLLLILLI